MSFRNSSNVGCWGDSSDDSDDELCNSTHPQQNACSPTASNIVDSSNNVTLKINGDDGEVSGVDEEEDDIDVEDDEDDIHVEDEEETEVRQKRIAEAKKIAQEKIKQKKKQVCPLKDQFDDLDDILNEFGIDLTKMVEKSLIEVGQHESDSIGEIEGKTLTASKKRKKKKKKDANTTCKSFKDITSSTYVISETKVHSCDTTLPDTSGFTVVGSSVDPSSRVKAKQQISAASRVSSRKSVAQLAAAKELKSAETVKKKKKKEKNNTQFGR